VRVILDTNVLMSAIFFGGIPGQVLKAWAGRGYTLVLSPEILDEYRRVGDEMAQRHPERKEALEPVLSLIAMNAVVVGAPPLGKPVSEDLDDDKFLACALVSGAPIIVSGDKDLLRVSG